MPRAAWVLLLLLLQEMLMGPGRLTASVLKNVKMGRSVALPCPPDARTAHWLWTPRFPKCAGVSGEALLIISGTFNRQELPPRFRGRLSLQDELLVLGDVVMSDSGIFTCYQRDGTDLSIHLVVEGGCFNNISISHFPVQKVLICKVCKTVDPVPGSSPAFSWTVNGGPPRTETIRGKSGARVAPDPSSVEDWGRWSCASLENPAWQAEYCFEPTDIDYNPPVDIEAEGDADLEASWKPIIKILVVAGAVLIFLLVAILFTCYIKMKSKHREKRRSEEELENMAGPPSACATLPTPERRPSGQNSCHPLVRSISTETSCDLLYVQLDHFPVQHNSKPPQPGERATIYATVV